MENRIHGLLAHMPDPSFRISLDLSKDVKPEPPPPRWRKRAVIFALAAAAVIIAGAALWKSGYGGKLYARASSAYRNLLAARPEPGSSAERQTASLPTPTPLPKSPLEEFYLGIWARNESKCDEAIAHFENALSEGTTLAPDEQARAWFWKGLCEYELDSAEAALASFARVNELDSTNTSVGGWIALVKEGSAPSPVPTPIPSMIELEGSLVSGFPEELIPSDEQVNRSIYDPSVLPRYPFSADYFSSKSRPELYAAYLEYFTKNNWKIMRQDPAEKYSALLARSPLVLAYIEITPKDGKSHVIVRAKVGY